MLSSLLIAGTLAFAVFLGYAIIAVPYIKSTISGRTGFYINADSIVMNVFTGKCRIENARIENVNNDYKNGPLAEISSATLEISSWDLLFGELKFSGLSLNIDKLNCQRISERDYNLEEFLTRIASISTAENFSNFSLKIKKASYFDVTTRDKMKWNMNMDYSFSINEPMGGSEVLEKLIGSLNEANANFISRSLEFMRGRQ